jgi:hypothetical protein
MIVPTVLLLTLSCVLSPTFVQPVDGLPNIEVNVTVSAKSLANLSSFVLFVGHPRSSHSLVGFILDSHPNMLVANEVDLIQRMRSRTNPLWADNCLASNAPDVCADRTTAGLYRALLERSLQYAASAGAHHDYDYTMHGQGTWTDLRVIGDKKGGATAAYLARDFERTLADFRLIESATGLPLRIVRVVRNPFDNIATLVRRQHFAKSYLENKQSMADVDERRVRDHVHSFFVAEDAMDRLLALDMFAHLLIHADQLLTDTAVELQRWCTFFDVPFDECWAQRVAATLYAEPFPARDFLRWSNATRALVIEQCRERPLYRRYIERNEIPKLHHDVNVNQAFDTNL